jgi:hypothetical protein
MSKIKLGIISTLIGLALLGTNLTPDPSFLGIWASGMLIFMGLWDFADHYAEIHTKARIADEDNNRPW